MCMLLAHVWCGGQCTFAANIFLSSCSCGFIQQVIHLKHQESVLQKENDLLKQQIRFRDEFIEVCQCT